MSKSDYKKLILVIVEGPSDDQALAGCLDQVFPSQSVQVEIIHGDLTTDRDATAANIMAKVKRQVQRFLNKTSYLATDIDRVVQIVDTDGAFVPKTMIHEKHGLKRFVYSETGIEADSKEKVVSRNKRKALCLRRMSIMLNRKPVPYQVYYMSCNLEHALFGVLNCSDRQKEALAFEFAEKYAQDAEGFRNFICSPCLSCSWDYKQSWSFIQTWGESLKRHTNLGLMFAKSDEH